MVTSWLWFLYAAMTGVELDHMETVAVLEGNTVTLETNLTELQSGEVIAWGFGTPASAIALLQNGKPLTHYDERFKSRLQLDTKTGSLTIHNITVTQSGVYRMLSNKNAERDRHFRVTVHVPRYGSSSKNVSPISLWKTSSGFFSAQSTAQASVSFSGPSKQSFSVIKKTSDVWLSAVNSAQASGFKQCAKADFATRLLGLAVFSLLIHRFT